MKALLLENVHPDAERILLERGYEVEQLSGALSPEDLTTALEEDPLGVGMDVLQQ